MAKTAMISMRIDAQTKSEAEKILDNLGLNMSTAFNMMCRQIVLQRGVPFAVKAPGYSNGAIDISSLSKKELESFIDAGWSHDNGAGAKPFNDQLRSIYGL